MARWLDYGFATVLSRSTALRPGLTQRSPRIGEQRGAQSDRGHLGLARCHHRQPERWGFGGTGVEVVDPRATE